MKDEDGVVVADAIQPGVVIAIDPGLRIIAAAWPCLFGQFDPQAPCALKLAVVFYFDAGAAFANGLLIELTGVLHHGQSE